MWERTLTINSTGKTFSMTGWKIGYAVGPAPLNAAIRSVHQFVTFATATPFQEAMAVALETAAARGYYDNCAPSTTTVGSHWPTRSARGRAIPPLPIGGSYFLMADISDLGFRLTSNSAAGWSPNRRRGSPTVGLLADPATAPLSPASASPSAWIRSPRPAPASERRSARDGLKRF